MRRDRKVKGRIVRQEIIEALGVAVQVKAGSALIHTTRVLDALKAKSEQPTGAEA